MLKTGFARTDITPPLGVFLDGYPEERHAEEIIDPLYATAIAFDNGKNKAVVMSIDILGINQIFMSKLRPAVAKAAGTDKDAVFIACTHTHTGPGVASVYATEESFENPEYGLWLIKPLSDTAVLAMQDLAPTRLFYTRGEVKDVSFIRRFRMKDGSVRTNPGYQNPDIAECLSTPDTNSSLLILKRENKPEIGIVNFQVHPDVVGGGNKISADYIKYVRDTYELLVPNSRCMYINGTQGDSNHVDVRLNLETDCVQGFKRAQYMGRKIAMSVVANYELAKEMDGDKITYISKNISVKYNKGTCEEIDESLEFLKIYREQGREAALPGIYDMRFIEALGKARRVEKMMSMPEIKEITLTALSVADVVFAGFPGEPFTDVGRGVKKNSPFTLTMTACCANGYEGYYPIQQAFDEGGYEAITSLYVAGTAEKLIEASSEIIKTIKG